MTNYELYEILGDIDERRVKEAREYRKPKKTIWLKWGPLAACLCLVAVVTFATMKSRHIWMQTTMMTWKSLSRSPAVSATPKRKVATNTPKAV